ncbi:hypothetical protein M426DRAFT_26733 [Hypoxylon sp. CI-4A]|nr:hypothetical protein M426DRAFT_26733 [Hypoxylon sp. CI-4A]
MPIYGPRYLSAAPLDSHLYERIGEGAQFEVFRDIDSENSVVYKRVKLENFSSIRKDRQSHLRTIEVEIRALCTDEVRSHPNIVHIQEWAYDYPNWVQETPIPVLVIEEAMYSLRDLLEEKPWRRHQDHLTLDTRYQLCLDVAAGLECLRKCEIIHGDIKPDNILIFSQPNSQIPLIAKLCDFGLSLVLEDSYTLSFASYQSTPRWKPPETITARNKTEYMFSAESLFKCDAYSYGLAALSILAFDGVSPIAKDESGTAVDEEIILDRALRLIQDLSFLRGSDEKLMMMLCRRICSNFLNLDPGDRILVSPEMIACGDNEEYFNWKSNHARIMNRSTGPKGASPRRQSYLYWRRLHEQISSDVLFGMAICYATTQGHRSKDKIVQLSRAAASPGAPSPVAQSLFPLIYDALCKSSVPNNSSIFQEMIFNATRTGSLATASGVAMIGMPCYEQAKDLFRKAGGYNKEKMYHEKQTIDLFPTRSQEVDIIDERGNTMLHIATIMGRLDNVRDLLAKQPQLINRQNLDGETSVYKACLAGNHQLTQFLVNAGASPSITETKFGLSCLHWLFNFEPRSIPPIAELLVKNGALIDARVTLIREHGNRKHIPFEHFPFHWPYGTPLHWACNIGSVPAAEALLNLGAHIDAADAPEDVRSHTPLALAMYRADPTMVSLLADHGADPNLADTKGFTPLHMLAGDALLVNRNINFSKPFFRWCSHGSYERNMEETRKCLTLIRDHGADLDSRCKEDRTALIDAIVSHDAAAVLALLEAGADANITSSTYFINGRLPLHLWVAQDRDALTYSTTSIEILDTLINHTTTCTAMDRDGNTVLHAAAWNSGNLQSACEVIRYLLLRPELLAEINTRNNRGETALLRAVQARTSDIEGLCDLIGVFKEHGADITARDNENCDILWFISKNDLIGDLKCREFMENYLSNFDVESHRERLNNSRQTTTGKTALMNLADITYEECVKLCIALKADVNAMTLRGPWSAVDFALNQGETIRHRFLKRWALKQMGGVPLKSEEPGQFFWDQGLYTDSQNSSSQNENFRHLYFAAPRVLRVLLRAGGIRGGGIVESARQLDRNLLEISKYDWFVPERQPYYKIWEDFYALDSENPSDVASGVDYSRL